MARARVVLRVACEAAPALEGAMAAQAARAAEAVPAAAVRTVGMAAEHSAAAMEGG